MANVEKFRFSVKRRPFPGSNHTLSSDIKVGCIAIVLTELAIGNWENHSSFLS